MTGELSQAERAAAEKAWETYQPESLTHGPGTIFGNGWLAARDHYGDAPLTAEKAALIAHETYERIAMEGVFGPDLTVGERAMWIHGRAYGRERERTLLKALEEIAERPLNSPGDAAWVAREALGIPINEEGETYGRSA